MSAEWSQFYRRGAIEALHACFVTHRYPRHAHDYFVVGLIESGAQSYWYRGAQHVTPTGQVFLVNAGEPHTGEPATPAGYVYRTLYPRGGELAGGYFRDATVNDPRLARLLASCHAALAAHRPQAECEERYLRAMARLSAAHTDRPAAPKPASRESPAVRIAREYLEAHFAQDVSLTELANLAGLSPYYFARAFAKETGLPPHRYLEGVRIRRARALLERGAPLADTALAVGYCDQSHLTHRFKRYLGVTPGRYASSFR